VLKFKIKLLCLQRAILSDWFKKVITCIYHIIKYSRHGGQSHVTRNVVASDLSRRKHVS